MRVVTLLLIMVFAFAAVAEAVVCQKVTDRDGNCLLPCICCHIAGVIHVSPIIHAENVTPYSQVPVAMAPMLLVSTFFHPPRV
ncbi:MAG: hypothetical protein PHU44_00795 [Syntrophales bacterium]|nr:hypothetical protein [Syntrophales bacterium]